MTTNQIAKTWNLHKVEKDLESAFQNDSENELLAILRQNSFLFYELYDRKYGIQPAFHEVSFGGDMRCDFAWLNDNSDEPEWVLVEVEKPKMKLFTQKGEPTYYLNHAVDQVKSWRRYFNENPEEKKRIFGAVKKFRYILIAGDKESWAEENAKKWRIDNNNKSEIEIRTSNIFLRSLKILDQHPEELWSFAEHPSTMSHTELKPYWQSSKYIMNEWRKTL